MRTIRTLLVANRGEIARRIQRTCERLGIRCVLAFSDADAGGRAVAESEEAVRVGPGPAAESYLDGDALIAAAHRVGADAVHPGYGFLSENAAFARAVEAAGLIWVGAPPDAIEAMGDKAAARQAAASLGIPVVPGWDGEDDADTLRREAARIGAPLLVKAVAGGGGRGMRRVDDLASLDAAVESARREAEAAFGSGRVLLERYVTRPRHVEVQVFGDVHGAAVHLGTRDCSVQRRHQKIVEEAPAPGLPEATRQGMLDAAVTLTRAVAYVGAGTVEFVVGEDGGWFFLEMNTRLQVEHPATEAWRGGGLDLVAAQLAVAQGRPLADTAVGVPATDHPGHAVEARVYAEDPLRDFAPLSGRLLRWHAPAAAAVEGLRVDEGYRSGDVVPPHYDSLLAKVITAGATRAEALRRLSRALDACWAPGLATNLPLLRELVRHEAFVAGDLHTGFLGEHGLPTAPPANLEEGAAIVAAWAAWRRRRDGATPEVASGFRLMGPAWETDAYAQGEAEVTVSWRQDGEGFVVRVGDGDPQRITVLGQDGDAVRVDVDGWRRTVRIAVDRGDDGPPEDGDTAYLHLGHGESFVRLVPRHPAPGLVEAAPGSLVAPAPGVVRAVHVAVGDAVAAGDPVVTLESMKVEHHLKSDVAGTVREVRAEVGESVDGGVLLVVVEGAET